MRIEQLIYIIEINQTGSISLAAEKLHVSQPNISQAIVSLEEELGVKLFQRSRIGAVPTEDGKLIISKAVEIMNKIEELREAASFQFNQLSGPLSIAAVPSLCLGVLPTALASFKQKHADVDLIMLEMNYPKIIEEVLSGQVDMGLIAVSRNYQSPHTQLVTEHLMDCRIMAYVGNKSPLVNRMSISIEELLLEPLLISSDYLINIFKKYGEPNILFKLGNSEAAKRIIAESIAIGFYTETGMRNDPYLETGKIIALEVTGVDFGISFHSIRLKGRHLSLSSKEFTKELKTSIAAINVCDLIGS